MNSERTPRSEAAAPASDRTLQDLIITALADAEFRTSPEWLDRGLADPDRMERFSRFLARHFYYERVVHFFKYSRTLATATGRRPEAVVAGEAFEALLPRAVLGSRAAASEVARLVVHDQLEGDHSHIPYFQDLLRYQEAMMVVEAGPRDWTGDERGRSAIEGTARAEMAEGTRVLELDHDLPAVLPALLGQWTEVPKAPRRPTSLLVARSARGRVSVVKLDASGLGIVRATEAPRSAAEIAERSGLDPSAVANMLGDLAEVGAVHFSIGS